MIVSTISHNTVPLCFLPNGCLVCYKRGEIIIMNSGEEEVGFPIAISCKERLFGWSKMVTRLLRFGARTSIAIDNSHIVISIGNYLYEVGLLAGTITQGWYCGNGIRPLCLSDVTGIKGFNDGLYFGQYWKNDQLNPVGIYYRQGVDDWNEVYKFPQGSIKHIHNLIPDPYCQCVWIMTGDFGDAAALWKATDGFKKVERVVFGDQKWRGCVGFALPEGLLYATDTPFSDNHIILLKPDGTAETMCNLSGSCIYGCQWGDKFVFSSTVEADGRDETIWKLLTSKKRGGGIKDNHVHLYVGNLKNGFQEVHKKKKDWLPFIFQFGAFRFPTGTNNTDMLYFQAVATCKNDLDLLSLK